MEAFWKRERPPVRFWRSLDEDGQPRVMATPVGPDAGVQVGQGACEIEALEDLARRYAAVPVVIRGPSLELERR